MIAAVHANSAYFKTQELMNARKEVLEGIEEQFADLIRQVYGARSADDIEEAMIANDPFFTAMNVEIQENTPVVPNKD